MPFTRVVFAYGEPIPVPRELDEEGAEEARRRIEDGLAAATARAEAALEETGLWKA
jgi:hypothetical protein